MLAAQGKTSEARVAYESAIKQTEAQHKLVGAEATPANSNYRDMLRAKAEQLGSAQ